MSKVKHASTVKSVANTETSPEKVNDPLDEDVVGDGKPFIGDISEAPYYLRDNLEVERGYRINFKNYRLATQSLFILHNESVNVWSHLCGALVFVLFFPYIFIYLTPPTTLDISVIEKWIYSPDVGRLDYALE